MSPCHFVAIYPHHFTLTVHRKSVGQSCNADFKETHPMADGDGNGSLHPPKAAAADGVVKTWL